MKLAPFIRSRLSFISLLLVFATISIYNARNQDWNDPTRLIKDDVHFYYIYAVSAIVYHDVKLERVYGKLPTEIRNELWLPVVDDTGKSYSKMSLGLSLIYAPFVAFAHYILVPLTGAEPDGYSPPYRMGLLISAMVFLLLGLYQLRKLLLGYFSESVTAITMILVFLGTNLTWYSSSEATMSHLYSFTLVIVMFRVLMSWLQNPSTGLSLLLGLVFGLMVLIRPTNIMFLVLFFATDKFAERLQFLLRNYLRIFVMITVFTLVWAPQFFFWKLVSGNWFLYTYGNEHFFWNNPQISGSLFSFRKGWLLYTPLMLLVFPGLIVLWKKHRQAFWQVLMALILMIYINSSWWCWWFGGSYGNRAYIDGYGIFALGVGALLSFLVTLRRTVINLALTIVLIAFVLLNLFQTWQYRKGLIHYVSNTRETYLLNFMRVKPHPDFFNSLVMPDHNAGKLGVYYPVSEITEENRDLMSKSIHRNKEYLIRYFIAMTHTDDGQMKPAHSSSRESQSDLFYRDRAVSRYIEMKKRYQ